MKCPYKYKSDCKEIDTSGMTKLVECKDCNWYRNGVIETGATPVLQKILEFFGYKPKQ